MDQGAALFQSIEDRDENKLKTLLSSKADPNSVNHHGITLLRRAAAIDSSLEIIRLLILYGADVREVHEGRSLLAYGRQVKKRALFLHHGVVLTKKDRIDYEMLPGRWDDLKNVLTAHDIMRERVARCRSLCIALWKAPFKQRDCKVWWIRTMVWPTRHNTVWTAPGSVMPEGYY